MSSVFRVPAIVFVAAFVLAGCSGAGTTASVPEGAAHQNRAVSPSYWIYCKDFYREALAAKLYNVEKHKQTPVSFENITPYVWLRLYGDIAKHPV